MNYRANFEKAGELTPDSLVAGNAHLLVARKVRIAGTTPLPRGAVIGSDGSGAFVLVTGSTVEPDLILAEASDGTATREVLAYSRGDFNANAVTVGAGVDVDELVATLRLKGIVLMPSMV